MARSEIKGIPSLLESFTETKPLLISMKENYKQAAGYVAAELHGTDWLFVSPPSFLVQGLRENYIKSFL